MLKLAPLRSIALKTCYSALLLSLLSTSHFAIADVKLSLEKPQNSAEKRIHNRLVDSASIKTAISFLNDVLLTPTDITLSFGTYDKIWYQNNRIEIPYIFIHNIRKRYNSARIPHRLATVDEFTGNALTHIIFHEMAHALIIDQYRLPVLGKEEDAADGLADVLLLEFFNNGASMVDSAADLFFMNAQTTMRLHKKDYWAEHSLDKQRYYARLCHIVGSNPEQHMGYARRAGFDDNRVQRCVLQYRLVKNSWMRLLEPALKKRTEPNQPLEKLSSP